MIDLRERYLAYLVRLEARDVAGLALFVANTVTHDVAPSRETPPA